jgi:hypothetical protein
VSCTLTRFSALTRFHNDKSLVDLTAAAAAATATAADDDGDGGAIATVFNARVAFPLQQTAPSLYVQSFLCERRFGFARLLQVCDLLRVAVRHNLGMLDIGNPGQVCERFPYPSCRC